MLFYALCGILTATNKKWGDCLTIGELIRKNRKEKKLTQKQLGELSGIAEPTIRRYELGKLNPKLETVTRIAKAMGVRTNDLLPQGVLVESEYEPPERLQRLFALEEAFKQLNEEGQKIAIERIVELSKIPEYKLQYSHWYCYDNSDTATFVISSQHNITDKVNALLSEDGE